MPVIGFINGTLPDGYAPMVAAFHKGLNERGYVEVNNVLIEYRWAEGRYDRLLGLAADLVRRKVTVIAANTPAVPVARAATTTIPIVFVTASDPIASGFVANLNRPGGNLTGVALLNVEIGSKRLELLHELVPTATLIGLLINPTNPNAESQVIEQARSPSAPIDFSWIKANNLPHWRSGMRCPQWWNARSWNPIGGKADLAPSGHEERRALSEPIQPHVNQAYSPELVNAR
jgi:ABC transporter substrate binding protein